MKREKRKEKIERLEKVKILQYQTIVHAPIFPSFQEGCPKGGVFRQKKA